MNASNVDKFEIVCVSLFAVIVRPVVAPAVVVIAEPPTVADKEKKFAPGPPACVLI